MLPREGHGGPSHAPRASAGGALSHRPPPRPPVQDCHIPSGLYEGFTAVDVYNQRRIVVLSDDRTSSVDDSAGGWAVRYCPVTRSLVMTAWGPDDCRSFFLPPSFPFPGACFGDDATLFPTFAGTSSLDDDVSVNRFVREFNVTGSAYEVNVGATSCMPYFAFGGSEVRGARLRAGGRSSGWAQRRPHPPPPPSSSSTTPS